MDSRHPQPRRIPDRVDVLDDGVLRGQVVIMINRVFTENSTVTCENCKIVLTTANAGSMDADGGCHLNRAICTVCEDKERLVQESDGSIHTHAYRPMTFAYGYGCKMCGRSILSHADRGTWYD